jgi:hypothetical protein
MPISTAVSALKSTNTRKVGENMRDVQQLRFYKDHAKYEKHLKMSHFLCEEPACKGQLEVFKTQGELENHNVKD